MFFIVLILLSILLAFTSSRRASSWDILIIFSRSEAKYFNASTFAISIDSVAAIFSSCQSSNIDLECPKIVLLTPNQ